MYKLINELHIVEDWFDELALLREKWDQKHVSVDQAHDLLALRMGFKRFKPDLIRRVGDDADQANLEWLKMTADEQGTDLTQKAISALLDFGAWLTSCDSLDKSYETETDPTRIAQLARELLDDLDRAELVELACERFGYQLSEEQDMCIAGCLFRCGIDGHLFVAAAGFVRSMHNSFDRSTMEYTDRELWFTTEKFRRAAVDADAAEIIAMTRRNDSKKKLGRGLSR